MTDDITIDDIREQVPATQHMSECEIVKVLSDATGESVGVVAYDLGLDISDYSDGADCRPYSIKLLTDSEVWAAVLVPLLILLLLYIFKSRVLKLIEKFKELEPHKKVVTVGAVLFAIICLFPPIEKETQSGIKTFYGFNFISDIPSYSSYSSYQISWNILSAEMIGVTVITAVIAYVVKK